MDWLHGDRPSLNVDADNVIPVKGPTEFYDLLIERIRSAKTRIVLSSLYLGTGELEQKLVGAIEEALARDPPPTVCILLDYLRGTRGHPAASSASLLSSVADRAHVAFFHSPELRGFVKSLLPERVNEIVSLQHMKFYVVDDAVIIAGANLSDTYFTNRQDRYVLIDRTPELADFFQKVFDVVAGLSFRLLPDGELVFEGAGVPHPFQNVKHEFCQRLAGGLQSAITSLPKTSPGPGSDTLLYPFFQFGPADVNDEVELLNRLFRHTADDLDVTVASGYFNLHDEYLTDILTSVNYRMSFIFAGPDANGFHNAAGFSGYIPSLYVDVSRRFFETYTSRNPPKPYRLFEYSRPDWSFHGKGIWIESKSTQQAATIIGSSNYGYRSVGRDIENNILLVTTNEALKQRLTDEKSAYLKFSSLIDAATFRKPDHIVPFWVKGFTRFFRNFF